MTVDVSAPPTLSSGSDYGTLLAQVREAKLLDRSCLSYLPRALFVGVSVAAGLVAFVVIGRSWWQIALAVYFAVVSAQVGFLGHDAGHQQIFRGRRWNDRFGTVLSTLGVGLSYSWWVDKHNRHHRHPNVIGSDPDVERNVLAWTSEQADLQRGAVRFIARNQAAFFFPLLLLEAWNLHVGSARKLASHPGGRKTEVLLLLAHVACWLVGLTFILTPWQAVSFLAVQQAVFGLYLGCSFAPNHKGMKMPAGSDPLDFLQRQVLTSRNITGGRLATWVFGGLNHQIEHHLFPSMPSHNLRRCRPLVKAFCATHSIPYCEASIGRSYLQTLRALHDVRPAKASRR